MPRYICDAERCCIMEKFEELHGTINGHPASILGRLLDFPRVVAVDGSGVNAEWTWEALRRAVDNNRVHLKT